MAMSINWNWNEKCGEAILKQEHGEFTLNLYNGNAYLIFVSEFTEDGVDKYNVYSFWADKTHAKRCLGLEKDADGDKYNMYEQEWSKITKFRINKDKCRDYNQIISMIARAFTHIDIEVYSEQKAE